MTDRRDFIKSGSMAALAASANVKADAPEPQPPATLTDAIERRATARMLVRLGLPPNGTLPREVQSEIREQAVRAGRRVVSLGATRDVEDAASVLARGALEHGFAEKMTAARAGIQQISKSQDVDAILQERAALLWKKRSALVAAGFSADETMSIILADISARSH